jgi:hypothetical protein
MARGLDRAVESARPVGSVVRLRLNANLDTFTNAVELIKRRRAVTSLLVPGYLDPGSSPEVFRLRPRSVFLGNGCDYLSMSIDAETDQLLLGITAEPFFPAGLLEEPTIRPGLADLSIYYLKEMRPVELKTVFFYTDQDSDPSVNRFRAILFYTDESRALLIDPYWPFGIKVGNEDDAVELREQTSQTIDIKEISLQ